MHVKVHLGGTYLNASSYYSGATYVHTGQLFFNDSFSDLVNAQSPYNNHSGSRLLNSADNIYLSGGSYTLMDVQYVNSGSGFSGGLVTSVQLAVTGLSSSNTTSATTAVSTTSSGTITTISTAASNSCGGRAGGRPFWLW
ncbi:hypothetical protein I4U23_029646 [Adineta vaga]|nr:hypothetical protein I4U23_029646 [Adineta vaga]